MACFKVIIGVSRCVYFAEYDQKYAVCCSFTRLSGAAIQWRPLWGWCHECTIMSYRLLLPIGHGGASIEWPDQLRE